MDVLDSVILTPAPSAPRATGLPWHLRVLDTLSAYLPVLLMGALALTTWWLVKNTPLPEGGTLLVPPRHEPDYTMTGFSIQRFAADGALRVQIDGQRLRHYPDTDTLEIDAPRIRALAPDGRVTTASAQRALSNGDASEVQLIGAARVLRNATASDAAIEFSSEFLHAFLAAERVRSHLPVTVLRGSTVVHADGLQYDNLARVVEFTGRMRAVFAQRGEAAKP
jgi:lipopolysaccharide export system protein LptC